MKLLLVAPLLIILLPGTPVAWAQNAPALPPPASATGAAPYRYCALVAGGTYFLRPTPLALDYGQSAPGALAEPEMAEMAKNISSSRSVIDALNYLSRHGWELLNVTNVQSTIDGSGTSNYHNIDSETRYLLRRRQ